ncbi:MAG TPA: fluoride efflux transporter CrcB [Candidatus Binataceae bacterium]|nr:fluoride efflux transporter CrcB [Candidatus Binataceae bacterium]
MAIWWVGLGGFIGANARYLLGGWISQRWGTVFPYGTFVINVTGSFILGFFMAYAQDRPWVAPSERLLFAVGFVGAYTTFSTFEYETLRLLQERDTVLALMNIFGSVLTGMVAVFGGFLLGEWI